ncbi:MAG TPA: hypothetical protein VGL02_32225 [Streptomyces sp.]
MTTNAIRVSQEWKRRSDGRIVTVLELDGDPTHNGFVTVRPLVGGRRSTLRVSTLRARYALLPAPAERNTDR